MNTPCDVSQSIPLLLLIPSSTKGLINKFLSSINFPNAFFLDHSTWSNTQFWKCCYHKFCYLNLIQLSLISTTITYSSIFEQTCNKLLFEHLNFTILHLNALKQSLNKRKIEQCMVLIEQPLQQVVVMVNLSLMGRKLNASHDPCAKRKRQPVVRWAWSMCRQTNC